MYLEYLALAPLCGVTLHVALFKHLEGPAEILVEEEVESVAATLYVRPKIADGR